MSEHCKRLAELNEQSATTAEAVAVYHEKMSTDSRAGMPMAHPAFNQGAGAPAPTDAELVALAAKASTPAEHKVLADYFTKLADRYTAAANTHEQFAKVYQGSRYATAAPQHQRLASLARTAADEARKAAKEHQELAGGR